MTSKSTTATTTNAFTRMMQSPAERARELLANSPKLIPSKRRIDDRRSRFIAHAARVTSRKELDNLSAALEHNPDLKGAAHNVRAWRYLALKHGRSGDCEDDFMVAEGSDDDGEQWAGAKLLKLMQVSGACDCCIVMTRWYGGEMLGPVRFAHMEAVTLDALQQGGFIKARPQPSLQHHNPLPSTPPPPPEQPPQTSAGVAQTPERDRAIRVLRARLMTSNTLKHTLSKLQSQMRDNKLTIRSLRRSVSRKTANGADDSNNDDPTLVQPVEIVPLLKAPPDVTEFEAVDADDAEKQVKEVEKSIEELKAKVESARNIIVQQEKLIEDASFNVAKKRKM